jgi:hypothetical protein
MNALCRISILYIPSQTLSLAQTHETVTFRYEGAITGNNKAHVLGDLPVLGGNDVALGILMVEIDDDVWEIDVSLPVNRDYNYQLYSGANAVVSGNSNRPALMPPPGSSNESIRQAAHDIPRSLRLAM